MFFVSRRRYREDVAAVKAEAERLRGLVAKAENIAKTEVNNRRLIGEQNKALDATVNRLINRLTATRRQLRITEDAAGIDHARAQEVGDRLVTVRDAVARGRKEAAASGGGA
ncbi:hypothetical protein O3Q52_41670 [Streptomyces sp. ActVer]|uniref:hypothetical protein n=1 Tax=Streptomyces sp. ActVer TaxID=3014558 RepID=UPI0022B545D3|nr:hypothetical protein [Streptomyces sp. ActVer]MCZ4514533.1 hypothetical protein [Streptomyces sp. ActVer]